MSCPAWRGQTNIASQPQGCGLCHVCHKLQWEIDNAPTSRCTVTVTQLQLAGMRLSKLLCDSFYNLPLPPLAERGVGVRGQGIMFVVPAFLILVKGAVNCKVLARGTHYASKHSLLQMPRKVEAWEKSEVVYTLHHAYVSP